MDIYSFLSSQTDAAHCRKIAHVFTPLEMAVIVNRSNKTTAEKHSAYYNIMDEYPDTQVPEYSGFRARDSLYDYLNELIEWENESANFKAKGLYYPQIYWNSTEKGTGGFCYGPFTTFNEAWELLFECPEKRATDWRKLAQPLNVIIRKSDTEIDFKYEYNKHRARDTPPCARLDYQGRILSLSLSDKTIFLPDNLSCIPINIPTPL